MLVVDSLNQIIYRFQETTAVIGTLYEDTIVLPNNYYKLKVGGYGPVDLEIVTETSSIPTLLSCIKTNSNTISNHDMLITALNGDMDSIKDIVYQYYTVPEEAGFTFQSGMIDIQYETSGIKSSTLQNVATFDLENKNYKTLKIKAWVSTSEQVRSVWKYKDDSFELIDLHEHGGELYEHILNVPEKATSLLFTYFKEYEIEAIADKIESVSLDNKVRDIQSSVLPAISLCGGKYAETNKDTLSSGKLEITEYPRYVKKEFRIVFDAQIETFDEIAIGVGYECTRGLYIKVNNTTVNLICYGLVTQGSEYILASHNHNLNIDKYIRGYVEFAGDKIIYCINTFAGSCYYEDNELGKLVYGSTKAVKLYDIYGYSFIHCNTGTILNKVILKRTDRGLSCPLWVFGDSLCSTDSKERWPYYILNTYNRTNWYLVALAGQTSNDSNGHVGAYTDLINALKYGVPKYLWWEIHANDTDIVYEEYLNKVINICSSYGITLILHKHGKIGEQAAGKSWEIKNNIMLSKNTRFVDSYNAVTDKNSTNHDWYEGYLSNDGVHPTELGAKAEAIQVLMDLPEIAGI